MEGVNYRGPQDRGQLDSGSIERVVMHHVVRDLSDCRVGARKRVVRRSGARRARAPGAIERVHQRG